MTTDILLKNRSLAESEMLSRFKFLEEEQGEHNNAGTDLVLHRTLMRDAMKLADAGQISKQSWFQLVGTALKALEKTQKALVEAEATVESYKERVASLEELATRDELTGVYNRRGFTQGFIREMDRVERGQSAGGLLIMIDLDNFKMINDTYGHYAGDEALKLIGRTLEKETRRMDMAARLGGDEFVLLFANADKNASLDRAQKLALKLNSLYLRWQGELIPVRASIGLKSFKAGDSVEGVIAAADATMYTAKEARKKKEEKGRYSA